MTWQDDVFVERLMRLDEQHAHRNDRMMARARPVQGWTIDLGRVLSTAGAGLIGLLSVPLLRFAMYHSQGLPDPTAKPGLVVMVDAIFAFCIAFFLVRVILSTTTRAHMVAQMAGIWVSLIGMHNLVHAYPDAWAEAFSPEWVQQTTQKTEANTLYLLGGTFP
ncbi:hypothetical protein [Tateyamaria sp. SN6-1]|uniref:hypothetical protein n=1 Tax=Tateyamaria sp. SN6-1 TaxID=3092148 RepID=UPI0039F4D062